MEFAYPEEEPVRLFVNAVGFHSAAQVLNAQGEAVLFWPAIANEAFALELFIKCLLLLRGNRQKGHDLQSLFANLEECDRLAIEDYFFKIIVTHPTCLRALDRGLKLDVESVLQRAKDAFTTIRYWHEETLPSPDAQGHISNAGTGTLSDAVRRRIVELQPELAHIAVRVPVLLDGEKCKPTELRAPLD